MAHHVAEARTTTQTLTFAVTETSIPNQITTVAVDRFPTTVVPTFVVTETSSVNQTEGIVVEAIITTRVLIDVAVGSCRVHRLVIIAVVRPCIGLPRKFAAKIMFYQGRTHLTPAVVEEASTTLRIMYAAQVLFETGLPVLHAVEQSTTIIQLVSAAATTCC